MAVDVSLSITNLEFFYTQVVEETNQTKPVANNHNQATTEQPIYNQANKLMIKLPSC